MVTRNGLTESEDQLVTRFIGGLRQNIQDALSLYEPFTLSEAHQKARQIEKQASRRGGASWSSTTTAPATIPRGSIQTPVTPKVTPGGEHSKAQTPFGGRCHKCSEYGHKATECRKSDRQGKNLLVEDEFVDHAQ